MSFVQEWFFKVVCWFEKEGDFFFVVDYVFFVGFVLLVVEIIEVVGGW